MSKRKILIIVILILFIAILALVIFLVKNKQQSTIPNITNVDSTELPIDTNLLADFINSNSSRVQMINITDSAVLYQSLLKGQKQVKNIKLNLDGTYLDQDSQLIWSADGLYVVVHNKTESDSGIIELDTGKKISSLVNGTKLISPTISKDNFYYYWFSDSHNNNISKSKLDGSKWQKVINLPDNFLVINLEYIPEKDNILILGTELVDGDFLDAKIYTINSKTELEPISLNIIPVSLKSSGGFMIVNGVDDKGSDKTYVLNQADWPDLSKADILDTSDFVIASSNVTNKVGIICLNSKKQPILRIYTETPKDYKISELFKDKQYTIPDSDVINQISRVQLSEISDAVIFENVFYLQVSKQIYRSSL